jgi:hypothetical protein
LQSLEIAVTGRASVATYCPLWHKLLNELGGVLKPGVHRLCYNLCTPSL